jgi:GAF domain-containing protein
MDLPSLVEALNDEERDLESRFRVCLARTREYLDAERGCLMVTRSGKETLLYDGDQELNLKFPFSRNVVGQAMIGRTGLVSFQSPGQLEGDGIASMQAHGVRAALCAPLLGPKDEDFGVIYFDTRIGKEFSQEQLEKVLQIARAIGVLLA